jgi:lysophospholipase L1-like esterase
MKKVLLLGDSLRMGYCNGVKELLKEQAEVYFPAENCRYTQYTLQNLNGWLNAIENYEEIEVIHWNNGHWDIARWCGSEDSLTSKEEYARMLKMILAALHRRCPKAQVIFATSTPMNPDGTPSGNPRTTEDIMQYNEVAKKVMAEEQVPVNDLFELLKDEPAETYKDYAHLTEAGYAKVAKVVAERVAAYL